MAGAAITSTAMSVGEVARRAGVRPSAIRYYESVGLLPRPARSGGWRRYEADVLDWLGLVTSAREAGFTMPVVRRLVAGFEPGTPPVMRWRALATRKLAEVDALVARAERMRVVLRRALACGCLRLEDCGRLLGRPHDSAPPGHPSASARKRRRRMPAARTRSR